MRFKMVVLVLGYALCPSPKVWGFDEMGVHSPCSNGNDDVFTAWWIHTV